MEHIFILLAIQTWISLSAEVLYVYVLPDSSTNAVSCPSQPCDTLSQYVLVNVQSPLFFSFFYEYYAHLA